MAPWGQASYTLSPKPCLSCSQARKILAQLRSLLSPGSRHAAAKPGTCPVVLRGSLGPCLELCDTDSGCPGAAKCCTTGCGHICKPPTEGKATSALCWPSAPEGGCVTADGCAPAESWDRDGGRCAEECEADSQCPRGQRCTSTGCGRICTDIPGGRVGACPVPREAGTCLDLCSFDEECPWGHKCCSNGCGHVCTPFPRVPPNWVPHTCCTASRAGGNMSHPQGPRDGPGPVQPR
uniref:WAP domain-containing protein n=1 Tax=Strigops habroptila TaxID=2489341 RepID=A0A672U0M1_STRHB